MVVSRALVLIAEDLVGADDLPEFQRGVWIVGMDVGVSALDGLAKRRPEVFSVVIWKRSE